MIDRCFPLLMFALGVVCAPGCAHWYKLDHEPQAITKSLPPPRPSPDIVTIETVILRLNGDDELRWNEVWPRIDEQAFGIELRRKLDTNGIRGGIIHGEFPIAVDAWVEKAAQAQKSDLFEQASIAADVSTHVQTLRCREGVRKDLSIRNVQDQSITLFLSDGQYVRGRTFERPLMIFDLRAYPLRDGAARVKLIPEIQHGQPVPTFIGGDFAFRREMRRPAESWDSLTIQAILSTGQTLLLTSTDPPRGLGEHFFFSQTAERKIERTVFLLRMVGTSTDKLFAVD